MAGGFQDFAGVTKMYVLRTDGSGDQQRIKFNYKKVIHGEDPSQNIELKPGDTVVVP
jgi:protein involved in polysaccharide export with SLBB domain